MNQFILLTQSRQFTDVSKQPVTDVRNVAAHEFILTIDSLMCFNLKL